MEFEAVGAITMSDCRLQVGRQIYDSDSPKWAFLWANAAANAEGLGYKGDAGFWRHFDTEFATSNDRARLLAFLTAFLNQKRDIGVSKTRQVGDSHFRRTHLRSTLFSTKT